jgi:AcrR family transcriptional regulator
MRDIAREMGMEAASLYNHIQSKQEILSELLLSIAQEFTSGLDTIQGSSLCAIDQLEALVALHVRLTVEHTDAIALIPNEWVHLEGDKIKSFLQLRDHYEKSFKEVISQCMKDGSLKKIDVEIATFSILSTLRWLYSWYSKHRSISTENLEKMMIQCLIYGLKSK